MAVASATAWTTIDDGGERTDDQGPRGGRSDRRDARRQIGRDQAGAAGAGGAHRENVVRFNLDGLADEALGES